jgi:hypothetical protein
MVVLAASVCTHGGRPIISRQFKELTKDRVTALLSNFPTLLSESDNSQHTAVEDEFVRYMYQPLEEFYVVLITNKHSNILQDIDTLHLFTQSITSILKNVDEKEIYENCFELLSAFDEIICLGYKENLTSSQIINFLEMDSHEERIQEIIERNKELEAAEASKKKAAELQFKEMMKKTNPHAYNALDQYQQQQQSFTPQVNQYQQQQSQYNNLIDEQEPQMKFTNSHQNKRGGMQLGKKSIGLGDSQPLLVNAPPSQRNVSIHQQQQQHQETPKTSSLVNNRPQTENNGILLTMNEKYSAHISREGTISSAEVKGDLQIRVNDPSLAHAQVKLSLKNNSLVSTQYKTHPNVDKKAFNTSSIITLKDPTKPFPSNDQNLGVLRWRSVQKDGDSDESSALLPIILTTWVNNNNNGTIGLTFEYEVDASKQVSEANLIIPIINASLESSDNDNTTLQYTDDGVIIKLTDLTKFESGSFEILCKDIDDEEALFPMELVFNNSKKVESTEGLEVSILSVVNAESQDELPFDLYVNSINESYYIV